MSGLSLLLIAAVVVGLAWWAWDEREFLADVAALVFGVQRTKIQEIANENARTSARIRNIGRIDFSGFDRFEAYAQCPTCERIALHAMRKPQPPSGEEMSRYEAALTRWKSGDRDTHEIKTWGGATIRTVSDPPPQKPLDEAVYDTIRTCECGQEWGQK